METESVGYFELGVLLFLTALVLPVIFYFRLFFLDKKDVEKKPFISFISVLIAFTIYLGSTIFSAPLCLRLVLFLQQSGFPIQNEALLPLAQLCTILCSFFLIVLFSVLHIQRRKIWGEEKGLLKGMLIGCICYPIVLLLMNVIDLILTYLNFEKGEQTAISLVRNLQPIPWLYWSYMVVVFTVVPIFEEILFRGFLQNYLRRLGVQPAILITSCIFAFFHYSTTQRAANVEILVGLFIFAYFLGVTYWKQRSLWASIGMHAVLNFFSLIFLHFFDG